MKKRIIGIDMARALAIVGMVIVNFKIAFGDSGNSWLQLFVHLFEGKAAATFVVLAGVGLSLMTKSAIRNQDHKKLKTARIRIIKRAIFLFVIGLSYMPIWPADILHFYGIYMLVALVLINQSSKILWGTIAAFILAFPVLLMFFDYEAGWNFTTFDYAGFWTIDGFSRNLFFNGFHPVFPWTAFMLFGVWYGRQDLYDDTFVKKSFRISLVIFIAIQLFSFGSIRLFSAADPASLQDLKYILGTSPMPPLPLYMLNGISISVTVISACILFARKFGENIIVIALTETGKLAFTFYVAHVVIGMGVVDELFSKPLGSYSITFSVIFALAFSLACILFAVVWTKYRKMGPLEWLMRKIVD
ncbi:MAG: DUF418 domain-containing protein [Balneolaceae bacterium]|nr:DUF418 domain-containing protein [Balneolaceae bacterium]